jgi:hypothetical protein
LKAFNLMVVIIAGTRGFKDMDVLSAALVESGWRIGVTEIVSGGEPTGVDRLGELIAPSIGARVTRFPADWAAHGRAAGPIRNEAMGRYAAEKGGRLLALWDGQSKGTASMLSVAKRLKIPTFIHYI